jgi:hypothetical protein
MKDRIWAFGRADAIAGKAERPLKVLHGPDGP